MRGEAPRGGGLPPPPSWFVAGEAGSSRGRFRASWFVAGLGPALRAVVSARHVTGRRRPVCGDICQWIKFDLAVWLLLLFNANNDLSNKRDILAILALTAIHV